MRSTLLFWMRKRVIQQRYFLLLPCFTLTTFRKIYSIIYLSVPQIVFQILDRLGDITRGFQQPHGQRLEISLLQSRPQRTQPRQKRHRRIFASMDWRVGENWRKICCASSPSPYFARDEPEKPVLGGEQDSYCQWAHIQQ